MGCLVKFKRHDALGGRSLEALKDDLRGKLAGRVKAAFLFGSASAGWFKTGSDIDLILVTETNRPFPDRFKDFEDLWDLTAALDLLVYTPAELRRMDEENSSPFWRAVKAGRIKLI